MRPRRAAPLLATFVASAIVVTGCTAEPDPAPTTSTPAAPSPTATATPTPTPTAAPAPMEPETVADSLDAPWSIAFYGDSVLVSERDTARIVEITASGEQREVGEVAGVSHGGEGGLLGLAVRDDDLYVYSTASGGNRVQRYALAGDAGSLSLGEPETIIDDLPAARTHNAGRIAFGPDGKLYVPVGDASDRPPSQDPDRLNGKILRLDPDGSIPSDNPTADSPVYSLGHRNVQGLAWDADGTLFASEFGQNTWDELNIIVEDGNYGWPIVEGMGGENDGFIDPIAQWETSIASPSGIAIVDGTVLIANLRGGVLRAVSIADPLQQSEHYAGEYGRLRDVVIGPDGAVWMLTNNTDGRGDVRDGDDLLLRVSPDAVTVD